MKNKLFPCAFSIIGGFVTWYAIAKISNKREAWDSGAYYYFGIPFMCLLVFAISWFCPKSVWRWTVAMVLGQAIAIGVVDPGASPNLLPLTLIVFAVFSIPQFIAGFIAARASSRVVRDGSEAAESRAR
jgi:Na+/melibiose symporter-like transporter